MNKKETKITNWYRKKFDRMGRIDGVFIEKINPRSITLIIDSAELFQYSNQVATIVSTILLSKWCNNIHIVLEKDCRSVVPGFIGRSMISIIDELISANDDEIKYHFYDHVELKTDAYLSIGKPPIENANLVWMDSDNWISGHGRMANSYQKISKTKNTNPVGPVFSACIAHSVIFKIVLGIDEKPEFNSFLSLYDYQHNTDITKLTNPDVPDKIELGKVIQVGCGAVGSSFDFILSLTNFKGIISLIDYDSVKPANLISSLLFSKKNALNGDKKVNVCERFLKKSSCNPIPFDNDYSGFIQTGQFSKNYPDIILCFANERNIWSTIQNNYPPLVLHATTTPNWGVNYGRHFPLIDWCIVCRFGIKESKNVPICAETEIEASTPREEAKFGVLPFLPSTSAIIVLAELIKLNTIATQTTKNFTEFNLRSTGHSDFRSLQMLKKQDCPICSDQHGSIYKKYLKKSKYKYGKDISKG